MKSDLVLPSPAVEVVQAERATRRVDQIASLLQRQGALLVLLLVVVIGAATLPTFRTYGNAASLLIAAAPPGLIALGMTFVIITGGIDLSVGSQYVLGGVVSAWASQYGWWAAILAPLLVCGAIGLAQGAIIAYARMAPFIVTLAGLLGARGLMQAISNEAATTYQVKSSFVNHFGQGLFLKIDYPTYLTIALFAIGAVALYRTRYGQSVYAVGGGEDAARLMGVAIRTTQLRVYTVSGLLAGFAGALNAARNGSGVTVLGTGMELNAIAAVVIGGTLLTGGAGTITGTIAGVLLLQVIQNLINQVGSFAANWQTVISGLFIAVVVVAQTYLARLQRSRVDSG